MAAMNVSCLQENLKRGLATVGHAVAAKSTLPVLSNILVATDNGRLRLQATNLEIAMTCWLGAKIETEGSVTIPAKLLSDFVSNLPNDAVQLLLDERTQSVQVSCARSVANIKGIEADEFPSIPSIDADEPTVLLPPDLLKTAIDQVAFAAASDDTRPVLAGVLLRMQGNTATLSASDGFRLAIKTLDLPEPVQTPQEVIVPARALQEVGRIIGDDPVEMTITASGGQILFHSGSVDLISRLIDGKFPDLQRVVPQQYATRAVLERSAFMQAARQASVFATASANIVKLHLEGGGEFGPGRMTITTNAVEVGDNKAELEGQVVGEGGQIALNVKFLQEALNAINTPQVALEMQTPSSPAVFRPVGDDSLLVIIMPMNFR
jgi:DNA polymerase-3 subunit beta